MSWAAEFLEILLDFVEFMMYGPANFLKFTISFTFWVGEIRRSSALK